jgi:hypothetical protein
MDAAVLILGGFFGYAAMVCVTSHENTGRDSIERRGSDPLVQASELDSEESFSENGKCRNEVE